MNPFEFILAILFMVFAFTIIRHRLGIPDSPTADKQDEAVNTQENDRLRRQVQQLQDRVHVLERIVTDSGVDTAAQIEALRDQDQIEERNTGR